MTKEQLRDNVLLKMSNHISKDDLMILKDVLTEQLAQVDLTEGNYLAVNDNTNEYYIQLFNTFKSQRLSEKSMKLYNFTLRKFCDMIHKPLTQVTGTDIEYFLMSFECSDVTRNNYRRNLSAFFSWMVKKRVITFNPVDEVDPYKEIKKPIDHLEPEDLDLMREGCKGNKAQRDRNRALVEFLRCTGVRVGELISVKISDVNFASGKVMIYGEKTKTYRYVYLDRIALGYVKKYVTSRGEDYNSDAPLFKSLRSDNAMTCDSVRSSLKGIAKRGDVKRRVYPHLMRKSCATSIIRRGGTVGDAGDYLGHSENSVTGKHYTFKDEAHIENIFNKYVAIV